MKDVKLFLTATNVMRSTLKVFKGKEVTADALMASACVPLLMEPVEINGQFYWDGSCIGNPSLFPLMSDCKSPDIIVILVKPIKTINLPVP